MSRLPRHLHLTGGDYFIHAMDRRMRRAGMPGNICRIALRLEGDLDVEQLRQRLAASPVWNWLARVRLVRFFPVLPPLWRATEPSAGLFHEHAANGSGAPAGLPPMLLERELCADRNPALALDLVRQADGSASLIFSWQHALMDVRGAELLLRHLGGNGPAEKSGNGDLFDPLQAGFNPLQALRGFKKKILFARGSLALINSTCFEPLFSLASSPPPAGTACNHCRIVNFSVDETARIDAHCRRRNAEFRRSLFYLAASVKALHAIAVRRGGQGAYLVPMPHDVRRRGATGPIFSNQLTFLFFRIEPQQAGNLGDTLGELTRQMTNQIRNRSPESFQAAMELFKPMPPDFYTYRLGRPTNGKFASFFFSDIGNTCAGMNEFLGRRISGVTHYGAVARPPGLAMAVSRYGQQLSAVVAHVEDCLSVAEADHLERELRAALLDEVTS
jgi:hypothetical protein